MQNKGEKGEEVKLAQFLRRKYQGSSEQKQGTEGPRSEFSYALSACRDGFFQTCVTFRIFLEPRGLEIVSQNPCH